MRSGLTKRSRYPWYIWVGPLVKVGGYIIGREETLLIIGDLCILGGILLGYFHAMSILRKEHYSLHFRLLKAAYRRECGKTFGSIGSIKWLYSMEGKWKGIKRRVLRYAKDVNRLILLPWGVLFLDGIVESILLR